MGTKLPWQLQRYLNNFYVLSPVDIVFGMKYTCGDRHHKPHTLLLWELNYNGNSFSLNHIEFIFGVKLPHDNRDQLHTSLLQQLGCHGNYSNTSITLLSLDVLSSCFS